MAGTNEQKGPLAHLRVIELAGLAPVPYCGMILKQFGAEVILVHRVGSQPEDIAGLGIVRVVYANILQEGMTDELTG
jgi:crotonobetainyl-CoA:carnitine CoA-transferase CaiB-like acyl-CoA transferase